MRKRDLDRFRKRLEDRLVELYNAAHAEVRNELAQDGLSEPKDDGDWSTLLHDHTLRMGLAENEAAMAQRIEEALRRMTAGDYGECMDCGTEIELARLGAVPWALRCADCPDAYES